MNKVTFGGFSLRTLQLRNQYAKNLIYLMLSYIKFHRYEGADRVRGRGEKRGGRRGGGRREKRGREEGEEGEGGTRRGDGRRERGGRKGGRGKEGIFARAKRAPLQKGGGRRGGGRGEVRGWEGGEAYPPVHPLRYCMKIFINQYKLC